MSGCVYVIHNLQGKYKIGYTGGELRKRLLQWREWIAKKKEPPKRPDAAFVAFCRKKFQQEGQ